MTAAPSSNYERGFADGVAAAARAVAGVAERLGGAPTESPAQRARLVDLLQALSEEIADAATPAKTEVST